MIALTAPAISTHSTSTAPDKTLAQLKRLHQTLLLKNGVRHKTGAREVVPVYWRKLIELGVPIREAKAIAWAIVRYDAAGILPALQQQQLLKQYCRFVCRAGLWRSDLLPTTPTRRSIVCSYAKAAIGLRLR